MHAVSHIMVPTPNSMLHISKHIPEVAVGHLRPRPTQQRCAGLWHACAPSHCQQLHVRNEISAHASNDSLGLGVARYMHNRDFITPRGDQPGARRCTRLLVTAFKHCGTQITDCTRAGMIVQPAVGATRLRPITGQTVVVAGGSRCVRWQRLLSVC